LFLIDLLLSYYFIYIWNINIIFNNHIFKWVEDLLDATEFVEENLILNQDTTEVSLILKSEFMI